MVSNSYLVTGTRMSNIQLVNNSTPVETIFFFNMFKKTY